MVFPACAGVILISQGSGGVKWCIPRMRGGDPSLGLNMKSLPVDSSVISKPVRRLSENFNPCLRDSRTGC